MIKEKISSQEIIDLVASKASVSKRAAEEFLKVMIASIEEALMAGEVVKIKNFGTFKLQWNQPRKSVNIQTGEEIMLVGYYKASFTPEIALKNKVNDPFAHLEPVELDVKEKEKNLNSDNESIIDPLRIFTEQASEIKSLISEIQALSPVSKSKVKTENIVKPEIEEDKIEKQDNEEIEVVKNYFEDQVTEQIFVPIDVQENVYHLSQENIDSQRNSDTLSDLSSNPFSDKIKPAKKIKGWLIILVILLSVAGTSVLFLLFYPPVNEFAKQKIDNSRDSINNISQNLSISELINNVSNWFKTDLKTKPTVQSVIIQKDTTKNDLFNKKLSVDSLQLLFDNPRVYNEFVASERIKSGSRLTIISRRYFGNKDFWVYIYEANKDRISNPDNIAKGTLIRIPKLDSRLIDANNPRCIKKAKELHDLYVKR